MFKHHLSAGVSGDVIPMIEGGTECALNNLPSYIAVGRRDDP
jgi:hypothetical protein